MRIAFFVSEDYNFMFEMFHNLIPRLTKDHTVVGLIALPEKLTKFRGLNIYLAYLKIFGLKTVFFLGIHTVIKRINIFLRIRSGDYQATSYEDLCRHYRIPRMVYKNPNQKALVEWVRKEQLDVLFIFTGFIIKRPLINAVKGCILNKHAGLLPAYKGVFPVFWAMKNDDPIGVTIHKVNERIDEGEIILQKVYPQRTNSTVYDYYMKIYRETPDLIMESLELLDSDKRKPYPHNLKDSYYSLPERADFKAFTRKGYRFV